MTSKPKRKGAPARRRKTVKRKAPDIRPAFIHRAMALAFSLIDRASADREGEPEPLPPPPAMLDPKKMEAFIAKHGDVVTAGSLMMLSRAMLRQLDRERGLL